MGIPTYEQYQEENPEASWSEYVSRFAAMSAHKQVEAGEIPSDYGASHSFTPSGVWVKSGSPASIGGLPTEIESVFPGVESYYQESYEQAVEGSVITTSRAGEPQISFQQDPGFDEYDWKAAQRGKVTPGGGAPVQFNDPGEMESISHGYTEVSNPEIEQFNLEWNKLSGAEQDARLGGNGNGNGKDSMGWMLLLLLGALALGMKS